MSNETFKICSVLVVATSAMFLTLGADKLQPQAIITQDFVDEENEFAGLNAVLHDDGYWEIAGVVGLSKDSLGRTVIEVKKDGDFEKDMVLTFPVRLVELDDGDVVVAGIAGVSVADDTLTLYMKDVSVGARGGVAAKVPRGRPSRAPTAHSERT